MDNYKDKIIGKPPLDILEHMFDRNCHGDGRSQGEIARQNAGLNVAVSSEVKAAIENLTGQLGRNAKSSERLAKNVVALNWVLVVATVVIAAATVYIAIYT